MPTSLNCAHCGVLFTTSNQQAKEGRKYCSSVCYRDREKANGPRKLVEPVRFECKQCGEPFFRDPGELRSYHKKYGRDPLYCSTVCGGTGRRTAKDIPCVNCGKIMKRHDGQTNRRRITCSQACRQAHQSKIMLAAHAKKPRVPRLGRHGYMRISVPDAPGEKAKERLEHRYNMEKRLGRPLRREETVHHVNGVKTDNRDENLELFSSHHGPGQRVTDKVAFAIEILSLYPEFAEQAGFTLVKREDH